MTDKLHVLLPQLVLTIMTDYKAWMVGSGAEYYMGLRDGPGQDFDLLVPPHCWGAAMRAAKAADCKVQLNRFGGLKLWYDKVLIDIWPGYLDDFFPSDRTQVAIRLNPRTIVRGGPL